jgi:hypothetical protein
MNDIQPSWTNSALIGFLDTGTSSINVSHVKAWSLAILMKHLPWYRGPSFLQLPFLFRHLPALPVTNHNISSIFQNPFVESKSQGQGVERIQAYLIILRVFILTELRSHVRPLRASNENGLLLVNSRDDVKLLSPATVMMKFMHSVPVHIRLAVLILCAR